MFKQYLLTALRTFKRNKVSTLINMSGLTIGICAALVIFLIVRYDFSFDRFEPGRERIYRIVSDMTFAGEPFPNSGVPGVLPDAVRTDVTGVEEVAPFFDAYFTVSIPATKSGVAPAIFKDQGDLLYADVHYFNLFTYRWLAGTPQGSLKEPYQVVLTEGRAKVYFPGQDPAGVLGRIITYNDSIKAVVTGVVADLNQVTDLHYKEFISYATLTNTSLKAQWPHDWGSTTSNQHCFIRLSPGTSKAAINKQLIAVDRKYHKNDPEFKNTTVYSLQPLSDIHFNGKYGSIGPRTANKSSLYGLMAAALFLLILACINYINLTTAQASQRAKEIGIRKTMGSTQRQLIFQFLGETFCITFLATLIGAALSPLLLKVFSAFIPEGVHFRPFTEFGIMGFLLLLILIVSFLAGFYPALVLSSVKPVLVLKNQAFGGSSSRGAWLRRSLTVFQFVIAQIFVLGTLLVAKQISYSVHKDLGYRKEAIVILNLPFNFYGPADNRRFPLKDKIAGLPGVERVSMGSSAPASGGYSSTDMKYTEGGHEINTEVQLKDGDSNYIKVYDLRLLAGNNIHSSDTPREYIINETFAHALGFRKVADAVGHHVDRGVPMPIVGVVADFHQGSLRTPIKPMAIESQGKYAYTIHVALLPQNPGGTSWKKTIDGMKAAFKSLYPDVDFDYHFFDDTIAEFYKADQDTQRLLTWATGLSILISCLGLLGLVLFTTRTRTKEIGVRKVLGASAIRIVALLSVDFMRLVGLAFVIAVPLSYWGMYTWLKNFADRTTVSWWLFGIGGLITLVTAMLTLSIQTIRAARANPVQSLRSE